MNELDTMNGVSDQVWNELEQAELCDYDTMNFNYDNGSIADEQ